MQFTLTFLVLGFVGWWLDGKLGTEPWLMIAGILLGAAGALVSLILRVGPVATRPASQPRPESRTERRPR